MFASTANHLSAAGMAGTSSVGQAGAALAEAAFSAASMAPTSNPKAACGLTTLSFMRHSIATHNEAAAASADAMGSVYLSEVYADSSLSPRGHALVRRARQSMLGLSPPPTVVFCSPLTRAIQTAIAMFGGTGIRIVAVPEVREAHGRFPCDRHRERSELELMFGDTVDFSLCDFKDTVWSPHLREDMSQLDDRVARFVDGVLGREAGHVFVVSHGVFIEAALRQLASGYPGYSSRNRVHNCDVHSFVFSGTPSLSNPAAAAAGGAPTSSPAAATSMAPPLPSSSPSAVSMNMRVTAPSDGSVYGSQATRPRMLPKRPQVEVYLTGQSLALACATGMPLPAVAHVNRSLRSFSPGDGSYLSEKHFSALLARCGLGAQETRWLYCALDREGGGKIASGDMLLAVMAFYSGEGGADALGGSHARVGLMDLRVRYQREMYGTPLANYELLDATFKRILSTLLSASSTS